MDLNPLIKLNLQIQVKSTLLSEPSTGKHRNKRPLDQKGNPLYLHNINQCPHFSVSHQTTLLWTEKADNSLVQIVGIPGNPFTWLTSGNILLKGQSMPANLQARITSSRIALGFRSVYIINLMENLNSIQKLDLNDIVNEEMDINPVFILLVYL